MQAGRHTVSIASSYCFCCTEKLPPSVSWPVTQYNCTLTHCPDILCRMYDKPIKSSFKQKPRNMLWSTANWPVTVTRHSPPSDTGRPVAAHVELSVDEVAIRQEPPPPPRSHFIPHYRRYKFVPLEGDRGSAPFITKFLIRRRWVSFSSTRLYPAGTQWREPPQCWKTENSLVPRDLRTTGSGTHSLATVRAHSKCGSPSAPYSRCL